MPRHECTLTDVAQDVYVDTFRLSAADSGTGDGIADWSVVKRRLRGGLSDGMDVVELHNGQLSVSILPTRGMGLWRGSYRGVRLGWDAPVALPVHPGFVDLQRRGGLGWLDGFNEWLCRCGLAFHGPPGVDVVRNAAGETVAEIPLTLHGRIANLPAHRVTVEVDEDAQTLAVIGVVEEASLFDARLQLTSRLETEFGSNRLRIRDEIRNIGGGPAECELLYHLNNGPPLLGAGSRVVAAFSEMAPRDPRAAEGIDQWDTFAAPEAGFAEQAYFFQPAADASGRSAVLLHNATGEVGLSVHFPVAELPWFVLWKNTRDLAEGYVTGLEPATSLPNLRTFEREQGRLTTLNPGESRSCSWEIAVHADAHAVKEAAAAIEQIQSGAPATVHRQPQPQWTP